MSSDSVKQSRSTEAMVGNLSDSKSVKVYHVVQTKDMENNWKKVAVDVVFIWELRLFMESQISIS